MTKILAFFDESGDLGWKFDAPYRAKGSSRYFVIAAALGEGEVHRRLSKVIKQLWTQQGWTSKKEKKWNGIPDAARLNFAQLASDFAEQNPKDKLAVSVLKKEELAAHLQQDHHLLYAHLATQLIGTDLVDCDTATVCPDELNAGTGRANLLQHLMRHELWFRQGCAPDVRQISTQKPFVQALEFCDMLAGAAASHFEDGKSEPWNVLSKCVTVRHGI
ncbi:DUF3800 domain-containing protein [Burkholderia stagnalis]|uniref:DUF3800 domain-containing protein n=1 Tax=Burkholderia stagnalis TaxID=1503054 RepID=UPI000F5D8EE2|nr:DUF3800 domain-containing protein [Burkholderia stagnalis]